MLDVLGLNEMLIVEPVEPVQNQLGREQTAAVPGSPVTMEPVGLAHQLRQVSHPRR